MMRHVFIVGAGGCGTTTLAALMAAHPEISFSRVKEPNFFSHDDVFALGPQWYDDLYADVDRTLVRGEGSVSYSLLQYETHTAERLVTARPDALIIYLARHPMDKITATFRELHHAGIRHGFDLPFDLTEALNSRPVMVENAKYWSRTQPFRDRFPPSQFLYLPSWPFRHPSNDARNAGCARVGDQTTFDGALRHGRSWSRRWPRRPVASSSPPTPTHCCGEKYSGLQTLAPSHPVSSHERC